MEKPDAVVDAMIASISHRGPDDSGRWTNGDAALGMSRLAIIDPEGGSQPRWAGPWCVVFNGEIYNHRELGSELELAGIEVTGRSDVEVVARAIQHWGSRAFARFDGMYAVAAYHRVERRGLLARDRFGEKPLYLWRGSGGVAFASEPRAFRAIGPWPELDEDSLTRYLALGFVPGRHSIWRDVVRVPPGHYAEVNDGEVTLHRTFPDVIPSESSCPDIYDQPLDELDRRLSEAVGSRLLSDVDVGVLLSGGIDSSLVAWYAARQQPGIRTFSVAVQDPRRDESAAAAAVADRLGTKHHVICVGETEALAVVEDLSSVYDEPFADSSAVPTLILSRFTSERVKVALSGDGGDELFSGYPRHASLSVRGSGVNALAALGSWATHTWWMRPQNPWARMQTRFRDPIASYIDAIGVADAGWVRRLGRDPAALQPLLDTARRLAEQADASWILTADQRCYLPDDLLTKIDRASMSCGLEVRAPFLAPVVSDWAARISPEAMGTPGAKQLPRALVRRHFGTAIADRPKQGFSVPLARWLRGSLSSLVDLACDGHLVSSSRLDGREVRRLGTALNRRFDAAAGPLWTIAMFELWYRRWCNPALRTSAGCDGVE